ncbi:hypothetical protein ARHIZOSPH14_33310 [Agromyces rhizosphaerae]|uniref:LysM domain-containing protein n=1 Tax=Agromyces rhizosphaerae TaxID=88374 RepID=A0A9W6CYF6_9MICO|nr:LysM peptidoglycan-binding domain-containing protein [Agromyces rhizosphaerae]GLI29089.1 hypothetical protein ARHIZOSPH14_33310 [Agromyces rhizosphaerae]
MTRIDTAGDVGGTERAGDGPERAAPEHGRHGAPDARPVLHDLATLPTTVIGTVVGAFGRFHAAAPAHGRRARREAPALRPTARTRRGRRPQGLRYTVAEGDTASAIAARFGIPTASVLATNGLGWSSPLEPGQELVLDVAPDAVPRAAEAVDPGIRHCAVVDGDTLADVAERHRVDLADLLRVNGLHRGSPVAAGQSLVLPGTDDAPAA